MYFVFEISRPFQIKPGFYRSPITIRVYWLWFAVAFHPMREDELLKLALSNSVIWERKHG
ncbi:MAG TPA: hypothetical protein VIY48_07740 [Candidatus Paceibacterota bacterium]